MPYGYRFVEVSLYMEYWVCMQFCIVRRRNRNRMPGYIPAAESTPIFLLVDIWTSGKGQSNRYYLKSWPATRPAAALAALLPCGTTWIGHRKSLMLAVPRQRARIERAQWEEAHAIWQGSGEPRPRPAARF